MTLETATTPVTAVVATAPRPGLILFGRDDNKRPHASCFDPDETAAAERAAELMGMRTLTLSDDAYRDLATTLPKGRIFAASGKAFVPFCKAEVFERLLAAAGLPDAPMPVSAASKAAEAPPVPEGGQGSDGDADGPGSPKLPTDWAGIGLGSLVLATEAPREGWFEAIVEYTRAGDSFTLRWRDWPLEPTIVRKRAELGLMPPDGNVGYRK